MTVERNFAKSAHTPFRWFVRNHPKTRGARPHATRSICLRHDGGMADAEFMNVSAKFYHPAVPSIVYLAASFFFEITVRLFGGKATLHVVNCDGLELAACMMAS